MGWRIAVDIGGTFTDLFAYDSATMRIAHAKTSTTPANLVEGIMRCLSKSEVDVATADAFVHGSTVAINTVIERKGAVSALVVTEGTGDAYTIGRGNRPEAYNIFFKKSEPLVPRRLTFEVKERFLSSGEQVAPLDSRQVESIASELSRRKVQAVAVCFLHSYANPMHEIEAGRILRARLPGAYVSLSHEILREYREYERISTTVVNCYIGPRVSKYVSELEETLRKRGFGGSLLLMQSNGGVVSPAVASARPVTMMESGPVGGIIAAAQVAKGLGYDDSIAFDMGGTTAKASLIRGGEPAIAEGYYVGGYASGHPVMVPVVDVVEVGAGGGSIAHVDEAGALKVGPRSSGAEPGPICYGLGGTEPTITDANVVLNRIDPAHFLGGEMPLDVRRAVAGMQEKVAGPLGLDPHEAAFGILRIANTLMSLAVREVSLARGYDPRDFALVAFGGAGPLHALDIARDLHIPFVIVPSLPAHFSAIGMILTDIRHDYVRTYYKPASESDFRDLSRIFDEMTEEGRATLLSEGVPPESMVFERVMDVRYVGQEFTLPVRVTDKMLAAGDAGVVKGEFDRLHGIRYGDSAADPVEIVNARVAAIGLRPKPAHSEIVTPGKGGKPKSGTRPVYLASGKSPVDCEIYQREMLQTGDIIRGPAVLEEYASTVVLLHGDSARVEPTGELKISVAAAANAVSD